MYNPTYNRFFPYKILKHSDKLEQIAKEEIPYPVVMHIYPSNVCNNNCYFCIMKDEKKDNAILPKHVLIKAVVQASQVGVKLIHFSGGGEPTLNPYLLDAIKIAKGLGMKVAISTNGSKFIPELVEYCDHIRVSLNAGTAETYDKDMKPNAHTFEEVTYNVTKYVMLRNAKDFKCDIGFGFVLSHTNAYEVYDFCKVANCCNVDFVHIRPAFLPNEDDKVKAIIKDAFEQSEKAKQDYPCLDIFSIKDKFDGYWTDRTYDKCRSTPLFAVLTASGEFAVCQDVFIKFGDLNTQDLQDIWGSDEHKTAMADICLKNCPRCVENRVNEVIQHVFIDDDVRVDLI